MHLSARYSEQDKYGMAVAEGGRGTTGEQTDCGTLGDGQREHDWMRLRYRSGKRQTAWCPTSAARDDHLQRQQRELLLSDAVKL